MAHGATYSVPFRRRSQGRTDYKLRAALVRSGELRLVIRCSNKYTYVLLVDALPNGDIVKASASSKELSSHGWKGGTSNLPAAYLAGLLAGKRAAARGTVNSVLDLGLLSTTKGSKAFAALKGTVDGGITVPFSGDVMPPGARLSGGHIADYAKLVSTESNEAYKKRFNAYIARGLRPEEVPLHFEEVRGRIQSLSEV